MSYGCRCGCESFREHVGGVGFRVGWKVSRLSRRTVDRTDTATVTTTERWADRQDVHVVLDDAIRVDAKGDAA